MVKVTGRIFLVWSQVGSGGTAIAGKVHREGQAQVAKALFQLSTEGFLRITEMNRR